MYHPIYGSIAQELAQKASAAELATKRSKGKVAKAYNRTVSGAYREAAELVDRKGIDAGYESALATR